MMGHYKVVRRDGHPGWWIVDPLGYWVERADSRTWLRVVVRDLNLRRHGGETIQSLNLQRRKYQRAVEVQAAEKRLAEVRGPTAEEKLKLAVGALRNVSFYARINHGSRCKDYGEIVDAVLTKLGEPTGEM